MPREEVEWFAAEMEKKLTENDHKGHWSNCTYGYLLDRLPQELAELETAVYNLHQARGKFGSVDPEVAALIAEAADVANFAMMIADNARRLINPPPEAPSDG